MPTQTLRLGRAVTSASICKPVSARPGREPESMSFAQIDSFAAETPARRKADPKKINSPAGASHLTVRAKP